MNAVKGEPILTMSPVEILPVKSVGVSNVCASAPLLPLSVATDSTKTGAEPATFTVSPVVNAFVSIAYTTVAYGFAALPSLELLPFV